MLGLLVLLLEGLFGTLGVGGCAIADLVDDLSGSGVPLLAVLHLLHDAVAALIVPLSVDRPLSGTALTLFHQVLALDDVLPQRQFRLLSVFFMRQLIF